MNLRSLTRRLFSRAVRSRRNAPIRNNVLGRPIEILEDRSVPTVSALGSTNSQLLVSSTLSNFTVNAGTDRLLVVAFGDAGSPTPPSAVTFGGTAMVQATSVTDSFAASDAIWYLPLGTSASSTTGNIVVTATGTAERFIGASAYAGVSQSSPVTAGPTFGFSPGTNVGSSIDVPSAPGDLVFDLFDTFTNPPAGPAQITTGAGQTRIHDRGGPLAALGNGHYVTSTEPGASSVTMSWTTGPVDGATAVLHATMNINQSTPLVNLSINDVSQAETNGSTTFTFTVALDAPAPAGGVTFDIATADNTATTANSDYVAKSLTGQTIAAGNTTYSFSVTVNGDLTVEANETFFVNVTNVTGTGVAVADGQGQGTIQNDDSATVNVANAASVVEGGNLSYNVTLSNPVDTTVSVTFATNGTGTATAGSDFTAASFTVTFAANTTSNPAVVFTLNDSRLESNESVNASISALSTTYPASVTLGTTAASGTITDNESATVSFNAASSSASENPASVNVPFTLTLNVGIGSFGTAGLDRNVVVRVADAGTGTAGSGTDYTFTSPVDVTFASGLNGTSFANTTAVNIAMIEDLANEPNETVDLGLSVLNANGTATTATPTIAHTFTIDNDDAAGGVYDAVVPGAYTLRKNGANVELVLSNVVIATIADGATSITLNGTSGNDTLTVDYASGGLFANPIAFNGGSQAGVPGDLLVVAGGSFATGTMTFTNPAVPADGKDGTLQLDANIITYTGLEPVDMTGSTVADLVFNLPAAASDAFLEDDGTPANGDLQLRSGNGTFETTIFSNPTGSLTINRGNAADTLTIDALPDFTAALTAGSVANPFATITIAGAVAVTGPVDLFGNAIASNATLDAGANTVTLNAGTGAITDGNGASNNVSAAIANLTAATGIDLDTNVTAITASTTGSGSILIDEANGVQLTSITAANGAITITAGGGITAVNVVSTTDAEANDISLTASTGNILLGTVNAGTSAGDVTLVATAGSILDVTAPAGPSPSTNLVTGDLVTLTAAVDIGSAPPLLNINTSANTIAASTTNAVNAGTHGIWINEANGVTLQSVTTQDGLIRILTAGNTLATSVAAAGSGRNVTITESTGDLTVGAISSALGNVTLTASTGNIFDDGVNGTVVAGNVLTLSAVRSIGAPGATGQIDSTATSVSATTTGAGPFAGAPTPGIWLADTNALNVTSATTQDGSILLDSAGKMTVTTVNAGGTGRNVRLQTSVGDIDLGATGTVTATGDNVRLSASGAITGTSATAQVTSTGLIAVAGSDVGTVAGPLNVAVSNFAGSAGTGGVFLSNAGSLNVDSVTAFGTVSGIAASAGSVSLAASNVSSTAAGTISTANGLTIDVTGTTGVLNGVVSGGATATLTKVGTGTLTLAAANTYTGATAVNNGTLFVNGSITSDTTVTSPAILGGTGKITGNVTGTGTVAPGNSPGILQIVGNFTPGGIVAFEVNPPTVIAGTDYDQLQVTGGVNLAGATLTFSGAAGAVAQNLLATLIANDLADQVTAGNPAEFSTVTISGTNYFLFYNGGDGNDVVLVEATQPTNVFVNDDWAGLNNGVFIADVDPLVGGNQFGVKGVNAFGDIAPALAVVAVGGTVEVLGSAAAGYGAFTLSNATTFVLANDTFFGQNTVTLNGAVSLDGQNFTPTLNHGAGTVNLLTTATGTITGTSGTPTVNVTSSLANTGSVTLNGAVDVSGFLLGTVGTKLDTITLAGVNSDFGITTFSNGITTLNGNLGTDGGDVLPTAVAGIRTGASITIDTEQGDDQNGGQVDLSAASVSSAVAGSNLTINTGTAFAGGTGGFVTLGGFTSAGGFLIQDLTIDATATTRGDIFFGAAAQIGQDLDATGKNISSNATFTAGGAAANTIDLDATGNVIDGNGAAQNFIVTLGKFSVDYTTGTVEADTTTTNFFADGDGNLTIRETDAINIQGASFGATRVFDLITGAAGNVTQDAAAADKLSGGSFRLNTGAGGTVTLANAANDIGTLAANTRGTTFYNDANALTVGTVVGTATTDGIDTNGNNLTLQTGGLLTIGDAVGAVDDITAAGAIVDLNATAGGVTEANAAKITSSSVRLRGVGTYELFNGNVVSTLAGDTSGGPVRFNNTAALTVGTVTLNSLTRDGFNTGGNDLTLQTNGLLTIGDAVGAADNIVATGRIVDLNVLAGGVLEANAAAVSSGSLRLRGTGTQFDLQAANTVGKLASNTTGAELQFNNVAAMTVGTVSLNAVETNGIATGGESVTLTIGGLLTIGDNIGGVDNIVATGATSMLTAAGISETNGAAVIAADIDINGTGTFDLNNENDATGVLRADVTGNLTFRDANDLTLDSTDVLETNGGDATLYAGEDFLAQLITGGVLVDAGVGNVNIIPGTAGKTELATFTYDAEIIAGSATFGFDVKVNTADPNRNKNSNKFLVTPSGNVAITVFGNDPKLSDVNDLVVGDTITPGLTNFSGGRTLSNLGLVLDQGVPLDDLSGTYTFTLSDNSVRQLKFRQIEELGGLGFRGIVVQTGFQQYSIRLEKIQQVPLPGKITGQALQSSPFVVSPTLVSSISSYSAPNIAFGDVNGDGKVDLIIASGANDLPLVTVINGSSLFGGSSINLSNLAPGDVLGQFYAFAGADGKPNFFGGLNVAVRGTAKKGFGEIAIGAGVGGGPRVQTFTYQSGQFMEKNNFFAFESSQRGGVSVAAGDYNADGLDDLVVGAGPGGGPRVRVLAFDKTTGNIIGKDGTGFVGSAIEDFFAYSANLRGGVVVASGQFNGAVGDEIATAPGYGGAPHILVWSKTGTFGSPKIEASFFAWDPSVPNGLQTIGTNMLNGVGSISFGAPEYLSKNVLDPNGRQELLVGSARGTALQLRRYTFAPGTSSPIKFYGAANPANKDPFNLYNELTSPSALDEFDRPLSGIPIDDPILMRPLAESEIFDGGSVAGYAS